MANFFNGFKEGMKMFGNTLSTLANTLLLTIVYIFGIGLTSIYAKIRGKSFLRLNRESSDSYWEDLHLGKKPLSSYYKQY